LKAVFIFSLDSKRLQLLGSEVAMELPTSAIMDAAGTTYVADAGNSRIVVYDAQGNYKTAYLLNGGKPVALAVNEILNRLYVVDRRGHKVVVLSLDGKMLFEFGGPGEKNGLFNIPLSIALDDHGDVYMLDSGNFRVQIFTSEGEFLSKFGEVGDRQGMFANPKGVAVDSDGNIYVTDAAYSNFQIFDRRGRFLLFVGTLGPYPGQMHLPGGIAIDESDRIYLADQLNGRIEVFQYLKTPKADY
jgi:DNA-binding beta-propeller fold protein YncE